MAPLDGKMKHRVTERTENLRRVPNRDGREQQRSSGQQGHYEQVDHFPHQPLAEGLIEMQKAKALTGKEELGDERPGGGVNDIVRPQKGYNNMHNEEDQPLRSLSIIP